MLDKGFVIKDILDYELENNTNILEELSFGNFEILHDLIMMSEKCDSDKAYELIDEYIDKYGYEKTFELCAYAVIGREPSNNDNDNVDKDYKSFSDVLEKFYNEIQTIDKNITLSDFWNISTKYMYRYTDGLRDRYIFNLNKQSQEQFINAETFIGLLFGKLKEPLQFDPDGKLHKKTKNEELIAKLKAAGHHTFM